METIFYGQLGYDAMQQLLNEPVEMQRYNFYNHKCYVYAIGQSKETDTHVYFSIQEFTPHFNKKLFFLRKTREGATYNKQTKELKIWFDKQFYALTNNMQEAILSFFKLDWFKSVDPNLHCLLNNGILKRMVKGKITNPEDFAKAVLKQYLPGVKVSHNLFLKSFTYKHEDLGFISLSPRSHFLNLKHVTNADDYLKVLGGNKSFSSTVHDLLKQACILDRKINLSWSNRRMNEVHLKWTKELMALELKNFERKDYNYEGELDCLPELSLIDNNYDLYIEGKTQGHCVYTNYESSINAKNYFVFQYQDELERGTLGVQIDKVYRDAESEIRVLRPVKNQLYGKYNSIITKEVHEKINNWLQKPNVIKWFINQYQNEIVKSNEECGFPF